MLKDRITPKPNPDVMKEELGEAAKFFTQVFTPL